MMKPQVQPTRQRLRHHNLLRSVHHHHQLMYRQFKDSRLRQDQDIGILDHGLGMDRKRLLHCDHLLQTLLNLELIKETTRMSMSVTYWIGTLTSRRSSNTVTSSTSSALRGRNSLRRHTFVANTLIKMIDV